MHMLCIMTLYVCFLVFFRNMDKSLLQDMKQQQINCFIVSVLSEKEISNLLLTKYAL